MPFGADQRSGSGFYRFRCKNFFTHNCDNWVWVNNSACAECCAAGREHEAIEAAAAWDEAD